MNISFVISNSSSATFIRVLTYVRNDIIRKNHAETVISNRRERSQNDLLAYCRAFAATRAMSYACR